MRGRWGILALLFVVRATMGFQFQSVAAVAPLLARDLGAGLADIGLLIGLYLAPGVAIALPGGALGRRWGDKPVVLAGLALMLAGGVLMALVPGWGAQVAGRLMAGTGGVLLNVLMSKMVTDWFAGREIATAMAVFVNSWPVGIAAALVSLPSIAATHGAASSHLVSGVLVAAGLLLLAVGYRPPVTVSDTGAAGGWPRGRALAGVLIAGLTWSLFNVGFLMIFAFGPSLLAERGWSVTAAGSVVSIVLWLAIVSVPLGGVLADRVRHRSVLLGLACAVFATVLVFAARTEAVLAAFIALGLVSGLPAGAIMGMPSRVLEPESRAVGMGLFFTVYYAGMFVAPAFAGHLAAAAGSAVSALDFGAAMVLACLPLIWAFSRLAARKS